MRKIRNIMLLTLSIVPTLAMSFGDDSENVYVKLYQQRLEVAEVEVDTQIARLDYDMKVLERMKILHGRSAVTTQELEEWQRNTRISELAVQELKAKVKEAQALLDIAKERIHLGLDMPICPSIIQ